MINFAKSAQKLAVAAAGAALSLGFINANPAKADTYRYTLDSLPGFTDYTEGEVIVDGVTYDGTFLTESTDPTTQELSLVTGTYTILDGSLGGPLSTEFLRDDYRSAGRDGLITTVYLPKPLGFDTILDVVSQLPEDTQEGVSQVEVVEFPDDGSLENYDVLTIPSQTFAFTQFRDAEGNPTPIVGLGWSATRNPEPIPEPDGAFAILLLGGGFAVKRLVFSKRKKVSIKQTVNSVSE